jgi:hypothetical protein
MIMIAAREKEGGMGEEWLTRIFFIDGAQALLQAITVTGAGVLRCQMQHEIGADSQWRRSEEHRDARRAASSSRVLKSMAMPSMRSTCRLAQPWAACCQPQHAPPTVKIARRPS